MGGVRTEKSLGLDSEYPCLTREEGVSENLANYFENFSDPLPLKTTLVVSRDVQDPKFSKTQDQPYDQDLTPKTQNQDSWTSLLVSTTQQIILFLV